MAYTIGLDYGTSSVRCLIADTADGLELAESVYEYETGRAGVILDLAEHNLARQNPADYVKGLEVTIKGAIAEAKQANSNFVPAGIIGIGVDTTGSTPIPVDKKGTALSKQKKIDPAQMPAVLVAGHGPFTWGSDPAEAVELAVILEQVAQIALGTISINPNQKAISQVLLDKHYLRKHGKDAYYGQKE